MGLLRKLLAETSRERAEWILWIDADTLIQVGPHAPPNFAVHSASSDHAHVRAKALLELMAQPTRRLRMQEMAFQMPLHAYADKNFIAWGDDDALIAGDPRNGAESLNFQRSTS